MSRAKQRGTSLLLKFYGASVSGLAVLFSGLFYVAASRLNSPLLSLCLYTPSRIWLSRSVVHNRRDIHRSVPSFYWFSLVVSGVRDLGYRHYAFASWIVLCPKNFLDMGSNLWLNACRTPNFPSVVGSPKVKELNNGGHHHEQCHWDP
ncbi:hypothetical protein BH20ACI3_BH20ACI3_10100 [soil metagenome]